MARHRRGPTTRRCPVRPACDLLVVGGGYAGLWTALHAAQRNPDQRIVLIDAHRIGWAASGRNGGFVEASMTHGRRTERRGGPTRSSSSTSWAWRTWTGCRPRSNGSDLDVEWQRTGMLGVATEPHQVTWLRGVGGRGGRPVPRRGRRARRGGLADVPGRAAEHRDTCAIVHPAKLVFELARACTEAGVSIYEHTNATSLDSGHRRHPRRCRRRRHHGGAGRAGDERLPPPACGATDCTRCRSTTTCWPPNR